MLKGIGTIRACCGAAQIPVAIVLLAVVLVEGSLGTEPVPIKKLRGKKYSEAASARDRADQMRAEYETRHSAVPQTAAQGTKPTQRPIDAEADKVVQAYQGVVDRYPHTEIAAYCTMRLSGFYIFMGKLDKAVELMEQNVRECAGTHEETKAIFELGLIHAQSRHDPTEAIKWLLRIPKPVKPAGAQYGEDDKLYLSAQEQLAKCELQLRHDGEAKGRLESVKQRYPHLTKEVDRFYQFEVHSRRDANASKPNPKPVSAGKHNDAYTLTALVSALVVLIGIFSFRQMKRRRMP